MITIFDHKTGQYKEFLAIWEFISWINTNDSSISITDWEGEDADASYIHP